MRLDNLVHRASTTYHLETNRSCLSNMKITNLEVFILRAPDTGRPHWVSNFIVPRANEILVRLKTDEGIEGFGIATSYTPIEAAIHTFRTGIGEQISETGRAKFAKTWSRERLVARSIDESCGGRGYRLLGHHR